jgi:hypothetical protein
LKSTQIALRESESRVEQLLEESSRVSTTSISVESQSYASAMSLEDVGDMEGLQAFAERYDPEAFDYAHVLQYGDQEPLLLESPLKAQVMITAETVEQIPCGSTNKEVYASRDCGDMYITDEDTSIWDPGSTDTSVVIDTVAHTGYKMICSDIQQYAVVCSGIQCYAEGYNGTQWETMEFRGESYSHLMEHGWSRGGRSTLLQTVHGLWRSVLLATIVFVIMEGVWLTNCVR